MKPIVNRSILLGVCATTLMAQSPGWRRFDGNPAPPAEGSAQTAPQQGAPPVYNPNPNYPNPNYNPQPVYNPGPPPAPAPAQITLPAGSWISIRVNQPLSSDHNHQGDTFSATLADPIVAQGFVIARRGQTLEGRVAEALKAGRIKGTSSLTVELSEVTLVDGQHAPLKTEFVRHNGNTSVGNDAAAIGTTTGVGAAIGAAADGGFGAGMGAIAGAGASIIGVLVTRGQPTVIFPEDTLTFKTTEAMTISTNSAPQAFLPVGQRDYTPQPNLQGRPSYAGGGPRPYGYPGPVVYGGPYYGPYPYYYGPGFYGPSVVVRVHGRRW
jgi:hypothetical protein